MNETNYSIVITTYDRRFDQYLKPLIKEIKNQYKDIEIVLAINGSYNKSFNEEYRKNVLKFISEYDNIYPTFYTKFNSLSKIWNRSIQNCTYDNVLVLNDDVSIKHEFLKFINTQKTYSITTINNIFSHYLINKHFLSSINWFDERFLGIGWEDLDIKIKLNYNVQNINTDLIYSFHVETYSVQHESIKPAIGESGPSKYSKFNENFFEQKIKNSLHSELDQYPYWKFETEQYQNL